MSGKIIYFPMRFDGEEWQTRRAVKEKILICGWAEDNIYKLAEETFSNVKNGDIDRINFEEKLKAIANAKSFKYPHWFKKSTDAGKAAGHIFRFILSGADDIFVIKTATNDFLIAKIADNKSTLQHIGLETGSIGFCRDRVIFSDRISKRQMTESISNEIQGQLSEKNINNLINAQTTCVYMFENKNTKELQPIIFRALYNLFENNKLTLEREKNLLEELKRAEKESLGKKTKKQKEIQESSKNEEEDALKQRKLSKEIQERTAIKARTKQAVYGRVKENFGKIRCENKNCKNPDSFKKENGESYFEFHHLQEVSKKGKHSAKNLKLLCANCHREIHFGEKNSLNYKTKTQAILG
jgi:predicted HNH restriction endonuclease